MELALTAHATLQLWQIDMLNQDSSKMLRHSTMTSKVRAFQASSEKNFMPPSVWIFVRAAVTYRRGPSVVRHGSTCDKGAGWGVFRTYVLVIYGHIAV